MYIRKNGAVSYLERYYEVEDSLSDSIAEDSPTVTLLTKVSGFCDQLVDRFNLNVNNINPRRSKRYRENRNSMTILKGLEREFNTRTILP